MPRPKLHSISLAQYQALALSDDGDFDAQETIEVGGAFISFGRHRDIGLCIIGCVGPDGGFVAELAERSEPRAGAAS